ncbi:MAG: DUF3299 domain-containing protein [Pyrinomonadaceae bacterium]|jgi:hypothetical protein|nr:DUF3299 domain-containing protein [Pyrinomonadaceae bacterium]
MSKKKETSSFVAILKTVIFFVAMIGFGWFGWYAISNFRDSTPKVEKKNYKYVDFNELAGFDYYTPYPGEKPNQALLEQNQIPEDIKNLNGAKVQLIGYMMPGEVDDQGNVSEFALNGNYDMCFYGAPSQINNWVHVKMPEGKKAPFSHNPIVVYGTLEVGEEVQNEQIVSIYRLKGDTVTTNQKIFN